MTRKRKAKRKPTPRRGAADDIIAGIEELAAAGWFNDDNYGQHCLGDAVYSGLSDRQHRRMGEAFVAACRALAADDRFLPGLQSMLNAAVDLKADCAADDENRTKEAARAAVKVAHEYLDGRGVH